MVRYYGYVFFSEMFLSSRRLWLVWKNKSSSKCAINSGKCQNYILIYLFFSILIVSRMMFCVRLLSKLVILLSTHHVIKHPTCRSKLAFESKFDLKNQNCWKIFLFSISYFLKFLTKYLWNFTKKVPWNQIFQVCS